MSVFTSTSTSIVLNSPTAQNPATVAGAASATSDTTAHSGDAVYGCAFLYLPRKQENF